MLFITAPISFPCEIAGVHRRPPLITLSAETLSLISFERTLELIFGRVLRPSIIDQLHQTKPSLWSLFSSISLLFSPQMIRKKAGHLDSAILHRMIERRGACMIFAREISTTVEQELHDGTVVAAMHS